MSKLVLNIKNHTMDVLQGYGVIAIVFGAIFIVAKIIILGIRDSGPLSGVVLGIMKFFQVVLSSPYKLSLAMFVASVVLAGTSFLLMRRLDLKLGK